MRNLASARCAGATAEQAGICEQKERVFLLVATLIPSSWSSVRTRAPALVTRSHSSCLQAKQYHCLTVVVRFCLSAKQPQSSVVQPAMNETSQTHFPPLQAILCTFTTGSAAGEAYCS